MVEIDADDEVNNVEIINVLPSAGALNNSYCLCDHFTEDTGLQQRAHTSDHSLSIHNLVHGLTGFGDDKGDQQLLCYLR